jgi:hypothetical protein
LFEGERLAEFINCLNGIPVINKMLLNVKLGGCPPGIHTIQNKIIH